MSKGGSNVDIIRKTTAAALGCAFLLCCGCSSGQPVINNSSAGITSYSDESSAASAFEIPDTLTKLGYPDLVYLGSKEIGSSPALEAYARNFNADPASVITVERVSDGAYEERLSELINSDMSPDLTDKRENSFPLMMSRNMYEDLTPYMDTSAPQWEEYGSYIDHYMFKSCHYFYPTSVTVSPQFLLYDKMKFVQYNIPDPEKLWEKGEWNWENFEDCAVRFREISDLAIDISGVDIADNVFATMGGSLIVRGADGKLLNSFNSDRFVELENFFGHFSCNQQNENVSALKNSLAVFMSADENVIGELRRAEFNVGIVPYPDCTSAGEYFSKAVSEGYMVPKGAKNITGAASFINCTRIVDAGDEGRKYRSKQLRRTGLLRSDTEWIELIRSSGLTPVLVDGQCLDDEANAAMAELLAAIDNVYFGSYELKSDIGAVDRELERINTMI